MFNVEQLLIQVFSTVPTQHCIQVLELLWPVTSSYYHDVSNLIAEFKFTCCFSNSTAEIFQNILKYCKLNCWIQIQMSRKHGTKKLLPLWNIWKCWIYTTPFHQTKALWQFIVLPIIIHHLLWSWYDDPLIIKLPLYTWVKSNWKQKCLPIQFSTLVLLGFIPTTSWPCNAPNRSAKQANVHYWCKSLHLEPFQQIFFKYLLNY